MKVCIVGAGAIGGLMGARLAAAGVQVSALARGATLLALQQHGWRLQAVNAPGQLTQAPARASDRAEALGVHDLVVVAVKGPALAALAPTLAPLIGANTVLLPAMNGVPWWFCSGLPGFEEPLASVDPGGVIAKALPLSQVLGCVVHASSSCPEPGLVLHKTGQGLVMGEPAGGHSPRGAAVAALFASAGFEVTDSADVRQAIWYKLWGNLTMNPVSAITGATIEQVLGDPLVRQFCSAAMLEAAAIGQRIGCPVQQSVEDRHAVTAKLGAFKTSMLQDVLAGRAIELDSIVGAVQEIGRRLPPPQMATPNIDALLGLTRLFARGRSLY